MSVIVLNRNYQFWGETNIQKVMKWFVKEKIEIVISDESSQIGAINFKINTPLVVRLLKFVGYKVKRKEIPYSAHAIFERDKNVCQYWHKNANGKKFKYKCSANDRTIDHVIPVSRGGKNSFKNCVCSCRHCNEIIKRNRTPEEADLELIRKPQIPKKEDYISIKLFSFNERNKAHKIYQEKILGEVFSHS